MVPCRAAKSSYNDPFKPKWEGLVLRQFIASKKCVLSSKESVRHSRRNTGRRQGGNDVDEVDRLSTSGPRNEIAAIDNNKMIKRIAFDKLVPILRSV